MYQNIYYDNRKQSVHIWDDEKGYFTLPYKRYAYGDVFRQEKADSARFRSFTQFDADVIGDANESQVDAEICNIIELFVSKGLG